MENSVNVAVYSGSATNIPAAVAVCWVIQLKTKQV